MGNESASQEIERALRLLFAPGMVWEVRAPKTPGRGTVSGYYHEADKCARDVAKLLDGKTQGVYVTLNPVKPECQARGHQRLRDHAETTTGDSEIVSRRWLPFDFDPQRPTGISSTDAEHAAALARADEVAAFLREGFGWPEPVRGDSGNGGHLLYSIDLLAKDERLVESLLKNLASAFNDPADAPMRVCLDTSVHNPARIWKLYGTQTRKGDNLSDRPHRRAALLSMPDAPTVVTREQIQAVISALAPEPEPTPQRATRPGANTIEDVAAWLSERGLEVATERTRDYGTTWVLERCVWDSSHTDRSAWVTQLKSGALAAGCQHNSCQGKGWREFRAEVEPGWQPREYHQEPPRQERQAPPPPPDEPESEPEPETEMPATSVGDVAPFPIEALPGVLQTLIRESAAAFPCPPDLVGLPLLVLAGAAIGSSQCLELKRTWHELGILWGAVVAHPGAKKTPVLKMLRACWDARQRAMAREFMTAVNTWEKDAREAKQLAAKGDDTALNALGEPPALKQAYVSDATMEALADVLIANPRGVALIRDEMDGWIRAMNEYKKGGADRQNWLSLWSGESFPINRRSRKQPVFVSDPFIGVVGGIQPEILNDLNDERGRQDGFVHRFLFAYPEPLPITGYTDAEVSRETLDALGTIFERLWMLRPVSDEDGTTQPVRRRLSHAAMRIWVRWNDAHATEQNTPLFASVLSGPWQKMVSYCARLALIVHLLRWATGESVGQEVDERSMAAACDLAEYFKAHTRRVYALLHMDEGDKRALAAVEWIKRQPNQKTTSRALQRAHVAGVKTGEEARALLLDLVDRGYGFSTEVASPRGKPSLVFTLRAQAGVA